MPYIRIVGAESSDVESLAKRVEEIGKLVVAPIEVISIINDQSVVYTAGDKKTIFVTVEWMSRVDKQQLLADFLVEHFNKTNKNVNVFFTDINGKYYVNGQAK